MARSLGHGPLTDRLKAAGHSVEAFDLPGLGDDHIPASEVTLDACAARLCEVLADSSEPAVVVGNSMCGSCTEDVAAWAIARQRPQPLAPFATPVSIPPGALDGISRYYVLCTRDRAIPPALQRRMIAENACVDVVALDTDHTPHLSMTDELAKALHRFATHSFRPAGRHTTS